MARSGPRRSSVIAKIQFSLVKLRKEKFKNARFLIKQCNTHLVMVRSSSDGINVCFQNISLFLCCSFGARLSLIDCCCMLDALINFPEYLTLSWQSQIPNPKISSSLTPKRTPSEGNIDNKYCCN